MSKLMGAEPATHIWVDPMKNPTIRQVIRDDGELKRVKNMERSLESQGETNLYRIVVVATKNNPIRIVPPTEAGE